MVDPTAVPVSSTLARKRAPTPPVAAVTPPAAMPATSATARAAQLIRRQLAVFSQHNLDAVVATFAPDARIFTGHRGPPVEGEQGVRIFVASRYAEFPGLALELQTCSCELTAGEGSHDGATMVSCEARWLARWHDPDSGQLVQHASGGHYQITGDYVVELRLHAWPNGSTDGAA